MDFFEGTEKLLEIWFTKSNSKCTVENDLRNIPRDVLDYILGLVNCKILSSTRTRDLDSYVLSESSLFINKQRLLIKTCGTTTLLNSVRPFIEAAFKICGFDEVEVYLIFKFAKIVLKLMSTISGCILLEKKVYETRTSKVSTQFI